MMRLAYATSFVLNVSGLLVSAFTSYPGVLLIFLGLMLLGVIEIPPIKRLLTHPRAQR